MTGTQPIQPPAAKKPPSGPGLGTYLLAGIVLAGVFAGMRLLKAGGAPKPEEPPAPLSPSGSSKTPMPGRAERKAPSSQEKSFSQGSLGYVNASQDTKGASVAAGPSGPSLNSSVMFFAGEGGPSSFEGRVVKTEAAWASLWRSVGGHDMPRLDVGKEMAIAVFGGIQPAGSIVQIFSAEAEKGRLVVNYGIEKPEKPVRGTCRPYKVVVIPASALPVVFRQALGTSRALGPAGL